VRLGIYSVYLKKTAILPYFAQKTNGYDVIYGKIYPLIFGTTLMSLLTTAVDLIMHLDTHLASLATEQPLWVYGLLFAVVFCESAFIVTPFLPGDSLLFAAGSIAALGYISVSTLVLGLLIAAIGGGIINFGLGRWVGNHLPQGNRWIHKKRLTQAQHFFNKYGANALVMARFVPIIRTFIPFAVGLVNMNHKTFNSYNAIGALLWIGIVVGTGYFFGNIPMVKTHFGWVIIAIIVISLLPAIISFVYHRYQPDEL